MAQDDEEPSAPLDPVPLPAIDSGSFNRVAGSSRARSKSMFVVLGTLCSLLAFGAIIAVFSLMPDEGGESALPTGDDDRGSKATNDVNLGNERGLIIVAPQTELIEGDEVAFGYEIGAGSPLTSAQLLVDDQVVDSTEQPDSLSWTATVGSHSVLMRVTSEDGATLQSEAIAVNVLPAASSTSSITEAPAPLVVARVPTSQISASASSELAAVDGLNYWASNVLDDDPSTAWNHNSKVAEPEGQWLRFDLFSPVALDSLVVTNGYIKSSDVFFRNHRVRNLTVELTGADGQVSSQALELEDSMARQTIPIDFDLPVISVRLIVDSIYVGSTWDDLAVSFVEIWSLS